MKKLALLIIGVLSVGIACADDNTWIDYQNYLCYKNPGSNVSSYCINISTYNTANYYGDKVYLVWIKYNYLTKQKSSQGDNFDRYVFQNAIDCNSIQSAIVQSLYYYKDNPTASYVYPSYSWSFSSDAPGTITAYFDNMVCNGTFFTYYHKYQGTQP